MLLKLSIPRHNFPEDTGPSFPKFIRNFRMGANEVTDGVGSNPTLDVPANARTCEFAYGVVKINNNGAGCNVYVDFERERGTMTGKLFPISFTVGYATSNLGTKTANFYVHDEQAWSIVNAFPWSAERSFYPDLSCQFFVPSRAQIDRAFDSIPSRHGRARVLLARTQGHFHTLADFPSGSFFTQLGIYSAAKITSTEPHGVVASGVFTRIMRVNGPYEHIVSENGVSTYPLNARNSIYSRIVSPERQTLANCVKEKFTRTVANDRMAVLVPFGATCFSASGRLSLDNQHVLKVPLRANYDMAVYQLFYFKRNTFVECGLKSWSYMGQKVDVIFREGTVCVPFLMDVSLRNLENNAKYLTENSFSRAVKSFYETSQDVEDDESGEFVGIRTKYSVAHLEKLFSAPRRIFANIAQVRVPGRANGPIADGSGRSPIRGVSGWRDNLESNQPESPMRDEEVAQEAVPLMGSGFAIRGSVAVNPDYPTGRVSASCSGSEPVSIPEPTLPTDTGVRPAIPSCDCEDCQNVTNPDGEPARIRIQGGILQASVNGIGWSSHIATLNTTVVPRPIPYSEIGIDRTFAGEIRNFAAYLDVGESAIRQAYASWTTYDHIRHRRFFPENSEELMSMLGINSPEVTRHNATSEARGGVFLASSTRVNGIKYTIQAMDNGWWLVIVTKGERMFSLEMKPTGRTRTPPNPRTSAPYVAYASEVRAMNRDQISRMYQAMSSAIQTPTIGIAPGAVDSPF